MRCTVEKSIYTLNLYYSYWLIKKLTNQQLNSIRLGEKAKLENAGRMKGRVWSHWSDTEDVIIQLPIGCISGLPIISM